MSTLVSTKGRYALRAMADLAEHQGDGYVPLAEIAARQGISEKYLEGIVSALSRAGFICGVRGKGGGYRLAREPRDYSVGEVVGLVEDSFAAVSCLDASDDKTCAFRSLCPTLPLWEELDALIKDFLGRKTLQDVLDQRTALFAPGGSPAPGTGAASGPDPDPDSGRAPAPAASGATSPAQNP